MALMKIVNIGRVKYSKALSLQKLLVQKFLDKSTYTPDPAVLLLEHHPVYTVGIRDKSYTTTEERLKYLKADFARTNRGGLITFHGPGQLMVYPIFNARTMKLGPRQYICNLEKSVIKLCKRHYNLEANTSEDTGVWIRNNKICAVGINAQQRIYSHGIAINCNPDLTWFKHIVPCGLEGKGVTSLTEELPKKNVAVKEVMPKFCEEMKNVFKWNYDHIHNIDSTLLTAEKLANEIISI